MNRKVLIIGNSDGIGAAITEALLKEDYHIVGLSKSPSPLGTAGPTHIVQDVSALDYPETLQNVVNQEGPFDICIYCAAIGSSLPLPDCSQEAHVIDVNFTAMVRTLGVLVPNWISKGHGHFIGLSSLADDFYNENAPSYTASKAGFSHYLVSMALRLRKHGIFVTNIRFGFVDTKLPKAAWKPLMMTADQAAKHVIQCLKTRPIQLSVPKVAGAVLHGIRWIQSLRVWTT